MLSVFDNYFRLCFYRFQNYRYKLKEAVKVEQIERIKAEELHQSKFKFFANISHEFLTPLSIISCSIEELKRMYNIDNKILKVPVEYDQT